MINEIVYKGNLSKIIQIEKDLYFREAILELRDQCNCGIVDVGSSIAMIDYTGQNPDEEILDEVENLLNKPVRHVLLTHAHADHVLGFRTLHRKGISVIASTGCLATLRQENWPIPEVYQEITKDTILKLDKFTFKLELPGRIAHSSGDMFIGLPKYKIVFTGDVVVLQKHLYFHTSDIVGWRKTVNELMSKDWVLLARGHGPIVGKEYLNNVERYLQLLQAAKDWIAKHDEPVIFGNTSVRLSPMLADIVLELARYADVGNISRQINELATRTKMGY